MKDMHAHTHTLQNILNTQITATTFGGEFGIRQTMPHYTKNSVLFPRVFFSSIILKYLKFFELSLYTFNILSKQT